VGKQNEDGLGVARISYLECSHRTVQYIRGVQVVRIVFLEERHTLDFLLRHAIHAVETQRLLRAAASLLLLDFFFAGPPCPSLFILNPASPFPPVCIMIWSALLKSAIGWGTSNVDWVQEREGIEAFPRSTQVNRSGVSNGSCLCPTSLRSLIVSSVIEHGSGCRTLCVASSGSNPVKCVVDRSGKFLRGPAARIDGGFPED
jgi:hypothetical protein